MVGISDLSKVPDIDLEAHFSAKGDIFEPMKSVHELAGDEEMPVKLQSIVCRRSTREMIIERYPGLDLHAGHRCLFAYLLQKYKKNAQWHYADIPAPFVAACYGMEEKYRSGNCKKPRSAAGLLGSFRRDVAPEIKYRRHDRRKSQVREASLDWLDEKVVALFFDDVGSPLWRYDDTVLFVSGAALNSNTGTELRRLAKDEATRRSARISNASEDSRRWIEYLNELPLQPFTKVRRNYLDEAWEATLQYSGSRQKQAQAHLNSLAVQPLPIYALRRKTARIFTLGRSLQTVNSDIRAILTQDWYEYDLRSAHLAIISIDWKLPKIVEFLSKELSIWEEIDSAMEVNNPKKAIKAGLYSAVYGACKPKIKKEMKKAYWKANDKPLPDEAIERFLGHWLIDQILKRRQKILKQIRDKKRATDCFGRELLIETPCSDKKLKKQARSILSQLSQAREQQLLRPLIALAEAELEKSRPQFRVVLMQHDGFSVEYKRSARHHHNRIVEAINAQAQSLDIPTRLEFDRAPS